MAKVMISIPDDLLGALDAEVGRRSTTRSALLQEAAKRELGLLRRPPGDVLADLDELSGAWAGPIDAAKLVRAERLRDG
jgi:hypothetical protein